MTWSILFLVKFLCFFPSNFNQKLLFLYKFKPLSKNEVLILKMSGLVVQWWVMIFRIFVGVVLLLLLLLLLLTLQPMGQNKYCE